MQWLSLVSEDKGVQNLKVGNRQPTKTRGVAATAPYPAVHSTHLGEQPNTTRQPVRDRRQGDRRQEDRRKKQVPVLLDTRSNRNRRGFEDRRQARQGKQSSPRKIGSRINVYA